MKINLNPVSFRANQVLSQQNNNITTDSNTQNTVKQAPCPIIEMFNYRLHDNTWSKVYVPGMNGVLVRMPNCYDGVEYSIYSNGKVVQSSGWSQPKVIIDKHDELAKYVAAMKDAHLGGNITFGNSEVAEEQEKSSNLLEAFRKSPIAEPVKTTVQTATDMVKDGVEVLKPMAEDTVSVSKTISNAIQTATNSYVDVIKETSGALKPMVEDSTNFTKEVVSKTATNSVNDDTEAISKKVEEYKNKLNDKKWEKLYSEENNTILLKQKRLFDGLEYLIYSDGTVKEVGLRIRPTVILENDEDSKKLFEKYNSNKKTDVNNETQKSIIKEKASDIWKYIASFGQMTAATVKGVGYGVLTGVSLLAGSWLFKTLPKAFTKEGPKLTQVLLHPIKSISKTSKVVAGVSAAAVMAYHIIVGKMSANQKTAVIEHKLNTGHREN